MLLAGEGFRDVCMCRRPQGSYWEYWEQWWDGVPAGGLCPSCTLAKPAPGTWLVAARCALGRCWRLLIKHLGQGVKNTQLASKKRGESGQWEQVTGGDNMGTLVPSHILFPPPWK